MRFPRVKKRATDFLLEEEGRMSKQTVMAVGGIAGVIASGSLAAGPVNAWGLGCDEDHPCGQGSDIANCSDPPEGTDDNPKHCYAHNNGVSNEYDESDSLFKSQHQHHYNHCNHASHCSHGSHGSSM